MTRKTGLLKDTRTGTLRATRAFRDAHQSTFGRAGHDLSTSFVNDKALLHAAIDTLDDDACDALAEALGLIGEKNTESRLGVKRQGA